MLHFKTFSSYVLHLGCKKYWYEHGLLGLSDSSGGLNFENVTLNLCYVRRFFDEISRNICCWPRNSVFRSLQSFKWVSEIFSGYWNPLQTSSNECKQVHWNQESKKQSWFLPVNSVTTSKSTESQLNTENMLSLVQWFPTGVPQHPGVPFTVPSGAAG